MDKDYKSFTVPIPSDYCLPEFVKPYKKAFDLPSSLVPVQTASILRCGFLAILAARRDEFNSLASEGFIKGECPKL